MELKERVVFRARRDKQQQLYQLVRNRTQGYLWSVLKIVVFAVVVQMVFISLDRHLQLVDWVMYFAAFVGLGILLIDKLYIKHKIFKLVVYLEKFGEKNPIVEMTKQLPKWVILWIGPRELVQQLIKINALSK